MENAQLVAIKLPVAWLQSIILVQLVLRQSTSVSLYYTIILSKADFCSFSIISQGSSRADFFM